MRIVSLINQKGGVGKTSTTFSLSCGLKYMGHSVLVVDLDIQRNCSASMGADESRPTISNVITGECDIKDAIQSTIYGDLLQGDSHFSQVLAAQNQVVRLSKLKAVLQNVTDSYEYVLIDTPPQLSEITLSALIASTDVLIPVMPSTYSLSGAKDLSDTLEAVIQYQNPTLKVAGIILQCVDKTNVTKFMTEQFEVLAKTLNTKVYKTVIRRSVAWEESRICMQDVFAYKNGKTTLAMDYANLTKEFIEDMTESSVPEAVEASKENANG